MLRFKVSMGIGHIINVKGPLKITLVTWPRVYLHILCPGIERPALFFPEGFSFMSMPLPPRDKKGRLQWKKKRIKFHKKTKAYFGAAYGSNFNVPIDWITKAVRENRDLDIGLNAEGELVEFLPVINRTPIKSPDDA